MQHWMLLQTSNTGKCPEIRHILLMEGNQFSQKKNLQEGGRMSCEDGIYWIGFEAMVSLFII
jgi:hypothetical protein